MATPPRNGRKKYSLYTAGDLGKLLGLARQVPPDADLFRSSRAFAFLTSSFKPYVGQNNSWLALPTGLTAFNTA
jgi:hypothetical protein